MYIYQPEKNCWNKAGDLPTDQIMLDVLVWFSPMGKYLLLVVLHHHQAHSSDNSLVTDIAMVLYVF
jgi:hypothetical protein